VVALELGQATALTVTGAGFAGTCIAHIGGANTGPLAIAGIALGAGVLVVAGRTIDLVGGLAPALAVATAAELALVSPRTIFCSGMRALTFSKPAVPLGLA